MSPWTLARRWLIIALGSLLLACSRGPSEADLRSAVESITESDVRARVDLIAADSMGGRDTPSPGLEMTAAYIASEFERMGLEPLGDDGGWYQHYPVRLSTVDPGASSIRFWGADGESVTLSVAQDASGFSRGAPDQPTVALPLVVMGGGGTVPSNDTSLDGAAVLWPASAGYDRDERQRARRASTELGAGFLIVALSEDDDRIGRVREPFQTLSTDFGSPTQIMVRETLVREGLAGLAAAMDEVRSSPGLTTVARPDWRVSLQTSFLQDESHEVPNVVGIVRGQDPALAEEYLVLTAHFDHVGSRCAREREADRICNGADDNASGTTGLLELAEAFAHPRARPRRSVIFAAVSGEERGLLGSEYFARNSPVRLEAVVANINMDHLGRNWPDSIVIIGGEHSDLGPLAWDVAEAHPELGVAPLPDQWPEERIFFRSDHYNFAREGVPILFFTNGFHDDYHRVTDSSDKIDAEKEARVVRYIFHVAHRIANDDLRPRWNEESYRQIVPADRRRGG